MVRFVVEQIPAPLPLEHQVDEALEHPLHGGKTERLAALRQGVVLLAECGQRRCRHPPHGQEELQLHLLALGGQIPQPHRLAKARFQRGIEHHLHLLLQHGRPAFVEAILRQQGGDVLRQRLVAGALKVDGLEQAVQQCAGARALREGKDGGLGRLFLLCCRQVGSQCGRLGHHLVIEAGIGQDPLAVTVTLRRQPGVGADPPIPLKGAGKVAHLRLTQLLLLRRHGGRASERGLTDGHSGQRLRQLGQRGRQGGGIPLLALLQQVADGGLVQVGLLRFAIAGAHRRQSQPGGVDAPGQRHIEQPQVFGKALPVGLGQGLLGTGEIEHGAIACAVRFVEQRGIGSAVAADEGQEHQRVLQSLGFVDGDDLHQLALGFEAQYLLRILAVGATRRLPQPAQQGIFAVQLAAHLLQQLAEVEEVGQPPLAVRARQQGGGEIAPVQQGAQHGQHAALVPDLAVFHKLLHRALPRPLVTGELVERLGIQIEQPGGERRPKAAFLPRVLAGVQNEQNLPRLHLGQHALAIRQVDRGDGEPCQLLLHSAPVRTSTAISPAFTGWSPICALPSRARVSRRWISTAVTRAILLW